MRPGGGRVADGQRGGPLAAGHTPGGPASLLPSGLIDELRIMVNPVVLGGGKSLLHTVEKRASLALLSARPFRSGNVLLAYRPAT
ncbi:MAG: dihydrofolate reductase family protein [Actinomycetota bacterium]